MKDRLPFPRPSQVVSIDPGAGNLDVRAYMAAVMGPQRAAFGNKSAKTLQEGQQSKKLENKRKSEKLFWDFYYITFVGD